MKKNILILLLPFMLTAAYGQKLNKDLLYGHWTMYSFSNSSININTDSLDKFMLQSWLAAVAKAPDHMLNTEDSLKLIKECTTLAKKVDSSYLEFNKNGTCSSANYFLGDGIGLDPKREKGTFKWAATGNRFTATDDEVNVATVVLLTPKRLSLVLNEGGKPEDVVRVQLKKK